MRAVVSAPWRVLLPPQFLRLTTIGRMACSARQVRGLHPRGGQERQQVVAFAGDVLDEATVGLVGRLRLAERIDPLGQLGDRGVRLLAAQLLAADQQRSRDVAQGE